MRAVILVGIELPLRELHSGLILADNVIAEVWLEQVTDARNLIVVVALLGAVQQVCLHFVFSQSELKIS